MITKPTCRGKSLEALREHGLGKSNEGMARRAADPATKASRGEIANEHFRSADWHFDEAKEIARNPKTRENCEDCLGRLGVEICPLLSEVEVSIGELFESLKVEERTRVRKALERQRVQRSIPIASKLGALTSTIDEDRYEDYLDPNPDREFTPGCPFSIDPHPVLTLAEELRRGVDAKDLASIGMGSETPRILSNGWLTSDEQMAKYLDPESILPDLGAEEIAV